MIITPESSCTIYRFNGSGYDRYFIPECQWQENKARNVLKSGMQNADSVTVYIPIESAGLFARLFKSRAKTFLQVSYAPLRTAHRTLLLRARVILPLIIQTLRACHRALKTLKQKHRCYAVMSIDEKLYGVTDLQHIKISAR